MQGVNGLHHITAIAGPAQENLDFYAGVLGMRLVKRSVNQDDPGTYHLFYADAEGHPGTDLTFFPWAQMAPPRLGHGLGDRGGARGARRQPRLLGPAARAVRRRASARSRRGSVSACCRSSIRTGCGWRWSKRAAPQRALHAVGGQPGPGRAADPRAARRPASGSARRRRRATFLTTCSASQALGSERGWTRYGFPDCGRRYVDVRDAPDARRGAWGVGSVHHLAWRVDDEAHQLACARRSTRRRAARRR